MTICTIFGCQQDTDHAAPAQGTQQASQQSTRQATQQGAQQVSPQKPQQTTGTIVALGDSLTAGFGLQESDAYPAQLERKLHEAGYNWKVVNAGISGETSSGTLSRIKWVLKLKPDIVILEIGANDGMRGVDPEHARKNIDKIVTALQQQGVVVVLAGMQMLRNLGNDYTTKFVGMYPTIANERNLIFEPFFLRGVAGDPNLNQADSIHPTAKGYSIITENIYPYVVRAIELKSAGTH